MTDSQRLLLIVALQLGLFGFGWGAAMVYLRESRSAFGFFFGFSIATGLGVGMLALRHYVPDVQGRTLANALVLVGLIMLWRGLVAMWKIDVPTITLYGVPSLGLAVTLWSGLVVNDFEQRVSVFFLTVAWIVTMSAILLFKQARAEFGNLPTWVLTTSGISVGLVLTMRTVYAWWTGKVVELDLSQPGNYVPVVVLLASISMLNCGLAFVIVARMVRRLDALSRHDALTGLLNRRALMLALNDEWARRQRRPGPIAVLALDIDHFKRINDQHGHATGDDVLRRMGELFGNVLRTTDRSGRTGGEEFVVLLADTDRHSALVSAERLRQAVVAAGWPLPVAAQGGVTVSIGVALARDDDACPAALLARADAALYLAKHQGRNRVVDDTAASTYATVPVFEGGWRAG